MEQEPTSLIGTRKFWVAKTSLFFTAALVGLLVVLSYLALLTGHLDAAGWQSFNTSILEVARWFIGLLVGLYSVGNVAAKAVGKP